VAYAGRCRPGTDVIEWSPIGEPALRGRIAQGEIRMTESDRRLWAAVRIEPEKWQQHPYGDPGGGFWAVGLIGRTVIWYNDVDDGFCRSRFDRYGVIIEYWRNTDELEVAVRYLRNGIDHGTDLLLLVSRLPKSAHRAR
jgi:hypothetical protein